METKERKRHLPQQVESAIHVRLAERRMEVQELAQRIDVPRSTVSRWMNGELGKCPLGHAVAMADALGCDLGELIDRR